MNIEQRQTAVISVSVTGQIDMGGFVATEAA